jgi:uncharacterized protein YcfJ
MHQEAKKGMLLTLGAIGLVGLGALITVLILKFTKAEPTSTATVPVVTQAPASKTPTPEIVVTPAPITSTMAQVISVQPRYSVHIYPKRVCHDAPRTVLVGPPPGASGETSGMGAIVGGLAGGALGNQVGQGRGRTAATIGGVVLGALAGNNVEGNMNQPPAPREETVIVPVCHTRYLKKSVITGYDVGYVYNGQQGSTFMKSAPAVGSAIPLTLQPG